MFLFKSGLDSRTNLSTAFSSVVSGDFPLSVSLLPPSSELSPRKARHCVRTRRRRRDARVAFREKTYGACQFLGRPFRYEVRPERTDGQAAAGSDPLLLAVALISPLGKKRATGRRGRWAIYCSVAFSHLISLFYKSAREYTNCLKVDQ